MQGNYISALDTLLDTSMTRILTCHLGASPKTSPTYDNAYGKSTFFVYPPERGEIGQSLPRLARFHLRPLQTGGSLSSDFLLHRCIQTAVPNHLSHAMNHSLIPSLLFKKQS